MTDPLFIEPPVFPRTELPPYEPPMSRTAWRDVLKKLDQKGNLDGLKLLRKRMHEELKATPIGTPNRGELVWRLERLMAVLTGLEKRQRK